MRISKIKKTFVLTLLLVFLGGGVISTLVPLYPCTLAGTSGYKRAQAGASGARENKANLPKVPFPLGEKLTFRVIYFTLPAGTLTLKVEEATYWEGHEIYRLVATARSSPLFSLFFRVRNRMESLLDRETFLPHRFEECRGEGDYRRRRVILFDRDENLAITFNPGKEEAEPQGVSISVPPQVQDALSAFYYLRRQNLKIGESFFIDVSTGRRNYQIEVEVLRRERLGRRRIETIVVRPLLKRIEMGGILEERGDIYIWLTDDERRLPVRIKAEVAIGSLTMILVDEELGK